MPRTSDIKGIDMLLTGVYAFITQFEDYCGLPRTKANRHNSHSLEYSLFASKMKLDARKGHWHWGACRHTRTEHYIGPPVECSYYHARMVGGWH